MGILDLIVVIAVIFLLTTLLTVIDLQQVLKLLVQIVITLTIHTFIAIQAHMVVAVMRFDDGIIGWITWPRLARNAHDR